MAKRIFKVIGIVLASIVGFVGVVVGIMAIMGKFKKPVVYPQQLVFAQSELMVVDNGERDDSGKFSKQIYSFELTGIGADDKEVTEKNCLLTITSGSNLIQLCDAEGKALTAEANGKYKIECNEKTYFKLKNISNEILTGTTYGRVTFRADDEKMMVGTERNNDMVVWIDRQIKKDSTGLTLDVSSVNDSNLGTKTVGGVDYPVVYLNLDDKLPFSAVSKPAYALNPISREGYNGKIVEFYTFRSGVDTDWKLITTQNLNEYPYLIYDEELGQICFMANSLNPELAGRDYRFRVAAFSTYAEREAYLEEFGNSTDITNLDRLSRMVWSEFYVSVKSTRVAAIGSETANVDLSLFETNNNIILNAESDSAKNLGLYMIAGGKRTNLRLNEANFDFRASQMFDWGDLGIENYTFRSYTQSNFEDDDRKLIADPNYNSIKLKLKDNVGVGDTFLDFFIYTEENGVGSYRLATKAEFDYEATYVDGTFENRTFNIMVKALPNINKGSLVLGAVVVNSNGEYYMTSINTNVAEKELIYSFTGERNHTLDIHYKKNNSGVYYEDYEDSALTFADIVNITAGSYRAGVLVTKKQEANEGANAKYNIEVLENIVFNFNGEDYVLVGYMFGNKFVNAVRAKSGANVVDTKIYMLQLKNPYQANLADGEDSAENYINSIIGKNITGNYTIGTSTEDDKFDIELNKAFIDASYAITIKITYTIVADTTAFDDQSIKTAEENAKAATSIGIDEEHGRYNLIAGFNYTIELSSQVEGMLENIYNATNTQENRFLQQSLSILTYKDGNLAAADGLFNIESVSLEGEEGQNKKLKITFSVQSNANSKDSGNTYKLRFTFGDVQIDSTELYILSNKPENIYISYINGVDDAANEGENLDENIAEQLATQAGENRVDVDLTQSTLYITIGYENDGYKYTYKLIGKATDGTNIEKDWDNFKLNDKSGVDAIGSTPTFFAYPDFKENEISYSIDSVKVENLEGLKVGNYTLTVSTDNVLGVELKVVVQADNTFVVPNETKQLSEADRRREITLTDKNEYLLNAGVEGVENSGLNYAYKTGEGEDATLTALPGLLNISNITADFGGGFVDVKAVEDENKVILSYNIVLRNANDDDSATIMTIARNGNGDWAFTRTNQVNTSLTVRFQVGADTFANSIYVTLRFGTSRQIDRNKNWTNIYAGTTILLYQQKAPTEAFDQNALFLITADESSVLGINVAKEGGQTEKVENQQYTFNTPGTYTLTFTYGNENVGEQKITVEANIFATVANSTLKSETSYNLQNKGDQQGIVTLKQYRTTDETNQTIVYGSSKLNETTEIYPESNLVDLADLTNVSISTTDKAENDSTKNLFTLEGDLLNVGVLTNLNYTSTSAKLAHLTINFNGEGILTFTVQVQNKYEVSLDKTDYRVIKDSLLDGVKVGEQSPTSVQINVDNYILSAENKVATHISEAAEGVSVTYTFTINEVNYTYTRTIKLLPYVPDKQDSTDATSETNYDIINAVFKLLNGQGEFNDANIYSIKVLKVEVDGEEDYSLFNGGEDRIKGVGYTKGDTQLKFEVSIGKITGAKHTIKVYYQIVYADAEGNALSVVRVEPVEITINNKLSIEANYPYLNAETNAGENSTDEGAKDYMFVTNDVIYMTARSGHANDLMSYDKDAIIGTNAYTISLGKFYEPVSIGSTIDFGQDTLMNIRRVIVKSGKEIKDGEIESISLVAASSYQQVTSYLSNISISGTKVTFATGSLTAGLSPYFLFKVTTTTGNYAFYLIKLYNQTGTVFNGLNVKNVEVSVTDAETINIVPSQSTITSNYGLTNVNSTYLKFFITSIKTSNSNGFGAFDASAIKVNGSELAVAQGQALTLTDGAFNIENPNTFVSITVAIVYSNAAQNQQFLIGYYTTNIATEDKLNMEWLKNGSGIGNYTATIADLNEQSILKSSDDEVKIESISLLGSSSTYFEVNNNTITAKETDEGKTAATVLALTAGSIKAATYVTQTLTFEVSYTINNTIKIKVQFTFNAVKVENFGDARVGSFDDATQSFNSTLDLSSRLSAYAGTIDLIGDQTGVTLDADAKTLKFTSGLYTISKQVTIKLNDLLDVQEGTSQIVTKSMTVTVVPAYNIIQGNQGGSSVSPYRAIANGDEDKFKTTKGSYAEISLNTDNTNYDVYTIGGLIIRIKKGGKIQFNVATDDEKYVVDAERLFQATGRLNFVHLAQSKSIYLTINLIDGDIEDGKDNTFKEEGDSTKAKAIDFYLVLPATYTGLSALYTIKGSNHDIFTSTDADGKTTTYTNFLSSYLFKKDGEDSKIFNALRMQLNYQVKEDDKLKDYSTTDFDAAAMGFFDKNNPNYLKLQEYGQTSLAIEQNVQQAAGSEGEGTGSETTNIVGDYTVKVNAITSAANTQLLLSNDAGLLEVYYSIKIVKGSESDKLNYEVEGNDQQNYLSTHSTWGEGNQFASVVIADTDSAKAYEYAATTTQTIIAQIDDVANNAFYLDGGEVASLSGTILISGQTYTFNPINGSAIVGRLDNGTVSFGSNYRLIDYRFYELVGSNWQSRTVRIEDANNQLVTYSIAAGSYCVLINRTSQRLITFNILRDKDVALGTTQTVTFNIYTNANEPIVTNFTLHIFNYSAKPTTTNYYATDNIKLSDLFEVKDNTSTNSSVTDLTYTLITDTGFYTIDGNRYSIGTICGLFEYDEATSVLKTRQVPADAYLTIYVQIKNEDDVIITTIQRDITIKCNLQFTWDGKAQASVDDPFKVDYDLGATGNFTVGTSNYAILNPLNLAASLKLEYADENRKGEINITTSNVEISVPSISVADFIGDAVKDYVDLEFTTISGTTTINLNFVRDFTGVVTIKLTVPTSNGNFNQFIQLNVTGLKQISYANNPYSPLHSTSGGAYNSGDEVKIVDSVSENPAIRHAGAPAGVQYTTSVDYWVVKASEKSSFDMNYLLTFTGKTNHYDTGKLDTISYKTNLPMVPQSKIDDPEIDQNHYVIYKIVFTYVQKDAVDGNEPAKLVESQPYFAIYQVRNIASVTLADGVSTEINVDASNNPIYDNTSTRLNLFYFAENYTLTSAGSEESPVQTIKIVYNGKGENEGEGKITFNGAEATYVINGSILTIQTETATAAIDYSQSIPELTMGTATYTREGDVEQASTFNFYTETFRANDSENTIPVELLSGTRININGQEYAYTLGGNILTVTDVATIDYTQEPAQLTLNGTTYSRTERVDNVKSLNMFNSKFANLTRFAAFIESIDRVEINGKAYKGLDSDGSTNGLIGINLTMAEDVLFTNSVNTTLDVYTTDGLLESVDLSLRGDKTITAKGTYSLSQIFQDGSYLTSTSANDYDIIAITSTTDELSGNWVSNSTGVTVTIGEKIHTFGANDAYKIYKATFSGKGVAGLYDISAEFNILVGASEITTVDYRSRGESNLFRVRYTEGQESSINMIGTVRKYYNNSDGALTYSNVDISSMLIEQDTSSSVVANDTTKEVKISDDNLLDYKAKYPTATELIVKVKINGNDGLMATISFELPKLTFKASLGDENADSNFDLTEFYGVEAFKEFYNVSLYIVEDDNSTAIVDLTKNADEANSVITMARKDLEDYKSANGSATYMKVDYRLTYTNANGTQTQEFAIRWML